MWCMVSVRPSAAAARETRRAALAAELAAAHVQLQQEAGPSSDCSPNYGMPFISRSEVSNAYR
jgi:hypothetical protein